MPEGFHSGHRAWSCEAPEAGSQPSLEARAQSRKGLATSQLRVLPRLSLLICKMGRLHSPQDTKGVNETCLNEWPILPVGSGHSPALNTHRGS